MTLTLRILILNILLVTISSAQKIDTPTMPPPPQINEEVISPEEKAQKEGTVPEINVLPPLKMPPQQQEQEEIRPDSPVIKPNPSSKKDTKA